MEVALNTCLFLKEMWGAGGVERCSKFSLLRSQILKIASGVCSAGAPCVGDKLGPRLWRYGLAEHCMQVIFQISPMIHLTSHQMTQTLISEAFNSNIRALAVTTCNRQVADTYLNLLFNSWSECAIVLNVSCFVINIFFKCIFYYNKKK